MNNLIVYCTAETEELRSEWSDLLAAGIARVAGGCTVIPAGTGYWVNETGFVVKEPSTMILAHCDNADQVYRDIRPLLLDYVDKCDQDCAFCLVDGRAEFISQDELLEV